MQLVRWYCWFEAGRDTSWDDFTSLHVYSMGILSKLKGKQKKIVIVCKYLLPVHEKYILYIHLLCGRISKHFGYFFRTLIPFFYISDTRTIEKVISQKHKWWVFFTGVHTFCDLFKSPPPLQIQKLNVYKNIQKTKIVYIESFQKFEFFQIFRKYLFAFKLYRKVIKEIKSCILFRLFW